VSVIYSRYVLSNTGRKSTVGVLIASNPHKSFQVGIASNSIRYVQGVITMATSETNVQAGLQTVLDNHALWLKDKKKGSKADLSRVDLSGAYLYGANLSRAYLPGANLSGANLSGADLSRVDLSRANLSRAYLHGAYLPGANLSRAYLPGADLYRAILYRAILCGADLSRANLYGANLSEADWCGAILDGAILHPNSTGGPGHILCTLTDEEWKTIQEGRGLLRAPNLPSKSF
jgi:uncharacterized protein YjbI with pentapeptide repeats